MQVHNACAYILSRLDTELDSRLTYHNLAHTIDVKAEALRIAHGEGIVDSIELALLETAACYHDAGFLCVYDEHEEEGCVIVHEILPSFDYLPEQIDTVCRLIRATRLPQTPTDLLSQIICDADLDYLGRDDYGPISYTLFSEWVAFGRMPDVARWPVIQQSFLEQHRYFTETNRKLREARKQVTLAELVVK